MIRNTRKSTIKYGINFRNLFKKELNNEPVYKDKYIKTKIKIYNDRVYTHIFSIIKYQQIMNIAQIYIYNIIRFYSC